MKKTHVLITAILIIGAVQAASAQSRMKMGIKFGIVWADQDWEYSNILGSARRNQRAGFAGGLFADLALTPALGIRPEALYVQKGSQIEVGYMTYDDLDAGTLTFTDRIDYLSLALSVKLQTGNGPFGLYVFGGPRVDLKLGTSTDAPGPEIEHILDSYNSTVTGITLGLGIQRSLGGFGPLLIEARYDHDLEEAAEHVGTEATLTIDNQSFAIMVGLAF